MNRRLALLVGTALAGAAAVVLSTGQHPGRVSVLRYASADVGLALSRESWSAVNPTLQGKPWCGAWALWKLQQAGLTDVGWVSGIGFVGPLGLRGTLSPQPGDIAYWDQPMQHYAIVESVNPLVTLDGNSTGGVVRRKTHTSQLAPLFYSIGKLLR